VENVEVGGLTEEDVPLSLQYANEAAAFQNMFRLYEAEIRFGTDAARSAGRGFPNNGGTRSYGTVPELIAAGLLDSRFGAAVSGYNFSANAGAASFVISAVPASPSSGRYTFYRTGGIVYYTKPGAPAPTFDARGRPDSRMPGRVQSCGAACLQYQGEEREVPGRVTVRAVGGPAPAMNSVLFSGLSFDNGGYRFAGVRFTDGTFHVTLPEGEHFISANNLPPGYSLVAATSGSVNLLKGNLKIGETAPEPIAITLEYRPPVR
jgi:hypothetical protein